MARLHAPVKSEPVAKYEAFVEQKLAQARGRIRLLDFTSGFLGFLIGTMAFALVIGWLDRWLHLSLATRQTALVLYGLVATGYLAVVFIRPWFRRLNPYYAARQVEQVLPGAKNSVINWLDLRHQPLPGAIRGALSHRAAKDIGQANMEEAVNGQQTLWLAAVTLVLFLITVAFMFFGPGLGRVFQPLGTDPTTEIHIVKPEGGNVTVAEGRAVSIEAVVHGRQTEALRFLYRHHQTDSYEERPMERGEKAHDWVITVPAFEVHNGFWYKLVGTEASTDEYHVEVRSAPAFSEFEITYHPRPYLRLPDETVKTHQPDLKSIRGTEVSILARTNRRVRFEESGLLVAGQKDTIPAKPVPDDPQAMRFNLVLDKDGSYGIQFTSTEGERNNPISYSITALPDRAPEVRITKPEEEKVSLPANGILQVEGSATDDHGLISFTLQMQVKPKDGPAEPLPAKPFRPGTSFQLADGSFPLALEYEDFVDLAKVRPAQPLQPGMTVEYWLEATDNCDFPSANVGRSKSKFINIVAPVDPQKAEEKKAQAQKDKEQKQAEQDQKLKDQNQAKQEQAKQDQAQPQENSQPNHKSAEEKRNQEIEKKLQEQLEQQTKQENPDGSKPDGQKDSEKGEGDKNPMGDPPGGKKEGAPNEKPNQKEPNKDEGDKNQKNAKENGKKDGQPDEKPGEGKDENKKPENPDSQQKNKNGKPDKDAPKGENKGQDGKDTQAKPDDPKGDQQKKNEKKSSGPDSKSSEKKGADNDKGQANSNGPPKPGMKDQGPKKDGDSDQPGQEKPANPPDKKPANEKKEQGQAKGESSGKDEPNKGEGPNKDKADSGQPKPGEGNSGDKPVAQKDTTQTQAQKKVSELLKAMKNGDAKDKEKARQQLQKMSEESKSPAERQAAQEALKQADKESASGDKPSADKKDQPGPSNEKGEKKGESSNPNQNKPPKPGEKKDSDKGKPGDGASSAKDSKPSDGKGKGDQEGAKGSRGDKGSDDNPGKPGSNSGGVTQGNRENAARASDSGEAEHGTEANKEFQKKAGALQLEDYRNKITPEMLQKANITKKEYDDFLKAYQDRLNREGADKSKTDPLADPKRPGGSLTNRAPREVRPTGQKEDKLPQAGRGTPPPGYDEPYSEFKEITSRSSRDKKK